MAIDFRKRWDSPNHVIGELITGKWVLETIPLQILLVRAERFQALRSFWVGQKELALISLQVSSDQSRYQSYPHMPFDEYDKYRAAIKVSMDQLVYISQAVELVQAEIFKRHVMPQRQADMFNGNKNKDEVKSI